MDATGAEMIFQVPGEGPLDCKIAFVGEAPGEREAEMHRPFVGAAGKLFNGLLASAGINRESCYVTNVIKERPPDNDISVFIRLNKYRGASFISDAYRSYESALYDELRAVRANVIVPMGNVALFALARPQQCSISSYRGSILRGVPDIDGRKLVPTIHPAAALREHIINYFINADLVRVKEESASPDIVLTERTLSIARSELEANAYLSSVLETKCTVAFDIETINEQVASISFARSPTDAMCIPFVGPRGNYFDPDQEVRIWRLIATILEEPDIKCIAQNAIFDTTMLYRRYGIICNNVEDTLILHRILYPDLPASLEFMTSIYTREPYYKNEGKETDFKNISSWDTFWRYNNKDTTVTYEIYEKLVKHMKDHHKPVYRTKLSLLHPLLFMSERGVRFDVDAAMAAANDANAEIVKIEEEFAELHPNVNIRSPKQLAELFYKKLGMPTYTNKGKVTVDNKALMRLSRKGCAEAKLVLRHRKLDKLRSTYYSIKIDRDGRLRGSYNPVGAWTGRLSSAATIFRTDSSEQIGANMQNLPHSYRKYLVADPGYLVFELDLSQAELRVVSYYGPERSFISDFENGRDPHIQTAAMIFGIPYEDVSVLAASCGIEGSDKSQRDIGKQANHALNYGEGYRKLALSLGIRDADAKRIYERYHSARPGIQGCYQERIRQQLKENRSVTNCYGKVRTFLDRWGDELFRQAYAYVAQSTVGDKLDRDGLIPLYEDQDTYGPLEILNQVHDSLWVQLPLHIGTDHIVHIIRSIVNRLETPVPFERPFIIPVEVKVGLSFGNMTKVDIKGDDPLGAFLCGANLA